MNNLIPELVDIIYEYHNPWKEIYDNVILDIDYAKRTLALNTGYYGGSQSVWTKGYITKQRNLRHQNLYKQGVTWCELNEKYLKVKHAKRERKRINQRLKRQRKSMLKKQLLSDDSDC